MNIGLLLLGILLVLLSLNWLAIAAISNTVLGILALITGVIFIVNALGVATNVNR